MEIVREIMPEGLGVVIQGIANDEGVVHPYTIQAHPISKSGQLGEPVSNELKLNFIRESALRLTELYQESTKHKLD